MNENLQQASIHAANNPLLYECVVRKNTGYRHTGRSSMKRLKFESLGIRASLDLGLNLNKTKPTNNVKTALMGWASGDEAVSEEGVSWSTIWAQGAVPAGFN